MIVLNVTYILKPGTRPEFEQEALALGVPDLSRAEDGNFSYGYYRPVDDENALLCVESWRDRTALEAHFKTDHVAKLQEIKKKYVVDTLIREYQAEA
jgi:quinol monooxygenase YgiN